LSVVVLDSSALITLLQSERGAKVVEDQIAGALMASINYGEAAQQEYKDGKSRDQFEAMAASLGLTVIPVDGPLALDAADIREIGRKAGLSQADCICLALAKQKGLPALTADQDWARVADVLGVEVRMIR
jgi:ribonuclease VapC